MNNVKFRKKTTVRQHLNRVAFNNIEEGVARLHRYVDSHHVKPGAEVADRATTSAAEQVKQPRSWLSGDAHCVTYSMHELPTVSIGVLQDW